MPARTGRAVCLWATGYTRSTPQRLSPRISRCGRAHSTTGPCRSAADAAALQNTMDKYGINENPKLYFQENGAWRLLLGDGMHCLATARSDVKAEAVFPAKRRAGRQALLPGHPGQFDSAHLDR